MDLVGDHSSSVAPSYVGRLAPSPTGALHLGNARTFLIAWLRARTAGGRLILRLEDLDHPKVKREHVRQVFDDLRWLGLDWDEGPDVGGHHGPYVQLERLALYRGAFERLRREQHIYPCVCTRQDILAAQSAPHAEDELFYPNTCRGRFRDVAAARAEAGREPAWRFRVDQGVFSFVDGFQGRRESDLNSWSGDFVIARGPDAPGYQLAVVVDDAAMGITEVVRADDLLLSTHRQLALYAALAWPAPRFLHVPLVTGLDGRRLAKRHGDTRLSAVRAAGTSPQRTVGWLAHTCGWAEWGEELTPEALQRRFSLPRLPKKPVQISERDFKYLGLQPPPAV